MTIEYCDRCKVKLTPASIKTYGIFININGQIIMKVVL
jgi:hypothetical protein